MSEQIKTPSVYLTEKVVALRQAIEFFGGMSAQYGTFERRVVFLSQIDFWDWEIENVIHAFETFEHRQEDWEDFGVIKRRLNTMGLAVRRSVLGKIKLKRIRDNKRRVASPEKLLDGLKSDWNALLDLCIETVVGDVSLVDIKKYRKPIEPSAKRD